MFPVVAWINRTNTTQPSCKRDINSTLFSLRSVQCSTAVSTKNALLHSSPILPPDNCWVHLAVNALALRTLIIAEMMPKTCRVNHSQGRAYAIIERLQRLAAGLIEHLFVSEPNRNGV